MKKLMMTVALLVMAMTAGAQTYNWAVGVRGGGANGGLTIKKYTGANALELGIDLGWDNVGRVQALYEWQEPVIADGFNFYYGAGAYVGAINFKENAQLGIGAEAVVGLEYTLSSVPIAFSLDYRPSLSVLPKILAGYSDIGFGIKYCF